MRIVAPTAASAAMHVSIRRLQSITSVTAKDWDACVDKNDYFTHSYMSALEAACLPGQWIWLGAEMNGKLIGTTFGFVRKFHYHRWFQPRVFMMGSPTNLGFPFAIHPSLNETQRKHVIYRLIAASHSHAQLIGAVAGISRDFLSTNMDDFWPSIRPESSSGALYQCAFLDISRHVSLEAYFANLKAKAARKLRHQYQQFERDGYHCQFHLGSYRSSGEDLLDLWWRVYLRKSDPDQVALTKDYFIQICRQPESVLITLKKNDKLVAFDLCLQKGEHLDSIFCGHLSIAPSPNRYMGLKIIEYAIKHRLRSINFGISNEQVKKEMGCRLQPVAGEIRIYHPVLQRALRPITDRFVAKIVSDKPNNVIALPSSKQKKVVVIGAGLAGLAAAAKLCKAGFEVEIIEADKEFGGQCRLTRLETKFFHTGCNLFQPKFFDQLDRQLGIRIPAVAAPIASTYRNQELGSSIFNITKGIICTAGFVGCLKTALRMTGLILNWRGWHTKTFAACVDFVSSNNQVIKDLLLHYATMNGLHPDTMPASSMKFLLAELNQPVYPKPGLQAVPQAMVKLVKKQNGQIRLNEPAKTIIREESGKVVGVETLYQTIACDYVISTLPEATTARLLGEGKEFQSTPGTPVVCIAVEVVKPNILPAGIHTFSFIEPELGLPSFDLVVPQNLHPFKKSLPATIFYNHEERKGDQTNAIKSYLNCKFPGFEQAASYKKVITPKLYPTACGFVSFSNYYQSNPRQGGLFWEGVAGLLQTRRPSPQKVWNSETALQTGFACADAIIKGDPYETDH